MVTSATETATERNVEHIKYLLYAYGRFQAVQLERYVLMHNELPDSLPMNIEMVRTAADELDVMITREMMFLAYKPIYDKMREVLNLPFATEIQMSVGQFKSRDGLADYEAVFEY